MVRPLTSRFTPPLYRISLSAPPRERYRQVCLDFQKELRSLQPLFDDILSAIPYPRTLRFLARHLLRRVYDKEENEEIKGISEATGIPTFLVVAFNSLLDVLSGCTSGGVLVRERGASQMAHFRVLDWEMDELAKLVIQVEYVRDDVVVARGITYAGYVGVLTGTRPGLSISMNFRPNPTPGSILRHQIFMLLGFRRSVASHLRQMLLQPGDPPTLSAIQALFMKTPTSTCFLTFCSPDSVLVLEKDHRTLVSHENNEFLVVTNHDATEDEDIIDEDLVPAGGGLLDTSQNRKICIKKSYNRDKNEDGTVTVGQVKKWMMKRPLTWSDAYTHFACVMDPVEGEIFWVESRSGLSMR